MTAYEQAQTKLRELPGMRILIRGATMCADLAEKKGIKTVRIIQ